MATIDRLAAMHSRLITGLSLGDETPVSGLAVNPVPVLVDFAPRTDKLPELLNFDPATAGQLVQLHISKAVLPTAPKEGDVATTATRRFRVVHPQDAGHVWILTCILSANT